MTTKNAVIAELYRQVHAPHHAAVNLDALLDVLRDLSWLPTGEVSLAVPDLSRLEERERRALLSVIADAVKESSDSERPIRIQRHGA